jgi:hypothetical protein
MSARLWQVQVRCAVCFPTFDGVVSLHVPVELRWPFQSVPTAFLGRETLGALWSLELMWGSQTQVTLPGSWQPKGHFLET